MVLVSWIVSNKKIKKIKKLGIKLFKKRMKINFL